MSLWLVDTGPLVAYLDARDPAHAEVGERLDGFSGQLATTSAVVTEVMHFVAPHREGPSLFVNFVAASGMQVYDLSQPPALRRAADLMLQYANVPLDYADATLLLLAEQIPAFDLLTLDRRGFSVFRTPRGKALRLVLDAA